MSSLNFRLRTGLLLALSMTVAQALTAAQVASPQRKTATQTTRKTGADKAPRPAPAAANAAATTAPGLAISDVIKMLEAKVSENMIAAKIRRNNVAFDPTPDELIALKKAGASDGLMDVLTDPSKSYTPPAAPSATPVPDPKPAPTAASAPPTSGPASPLEIGVYIKKGTDWMELRPEIVNWKTGGTIKSLASAGVVKKDLNGNIEGPSSRSSVKTPLEVLIITPEGVAAEEYQFLRLRVNKDYREFRSVTGGILNQRGGAMRDLIPFEAKKISSRNYLIVVPASIGAGEYGFLPPGAGGSSTTNAVSSQYGKMFTFHVVE